MYILENMNNYTTSFNNDSDINLYLYVGGPSLHTRITFASAWIFIAVAGIIGKRKNIIDSKIFISFFL